MDFAAPHPPAEMHTSPRHVRWNIQCVLKPGARARGTMAEALVKAVAEIQGDAN